MRRWWAVGLLLVGCATTRVPAEEPALAFPEIPHIDSIACTIEGCCFSLADANTLNRWMKKLLEFKEQREKLIKTP